MEQITQEILISNILADFKLYQISRIEGVGLLEILKLMIYNGVND